MSKKEEHAFIKISKDIKAGKIPAVVFMRGKEEYLVNFYCETLIKKYVNKACEALDLIIFDRENVTANNIIENLETMALMSERKVVFLPGFFDERGKLPKNFADSEKETELLAEYLQTLKKSEPEGVLLIVTEAAQSEDKKDRSKRKDKLVKAFTGAGKTYDFGHLDPGQLRAFIEKRFKSAGKTYRPGIVSAIARESGYGNKNVDYGLFNLDNDLKKIIAHSGSSQEITTGDLSGVVTVSPENDVFAMLDAIGKNRKDEAFRMLNNLFYDGIEEMPLLSLLIKQLELMLTTCEMHNQGMSLAVIQETLKKKEKIHLYRTQKAFEAGRRFRIEELRRILSSAYNIEPDIKSGFMPGRLAFEYFIASI